MWKLFKTLFWNAHFIIFIIIIIITFFYFIASTSSSLHLQLCGLEWVYVHIYVCDTHIIVLNKIA